MSYDDEFARLRRVPVTFLYCLLLVMIALTVVMIIRVVGLILVIALLTIPPFIAEKFTGSLRAMMVVASLLSCLFTVSGLWLSYLFNLTSGATIILVAAVGFFAAALWGRFKPRHPGNAIGLGGRAGLKENTPCASAAIIPTCLTWAASIPRPAACGCWK